MLTCREHLDYFQISRKMPNPLWVHALDVLAHTLKGERDDTFFKDRDRGDRHIDDLRKHIDGRAKEVDSFLEEKHNAFVAERRWKRFDAEAGDLSVERYLDGEPRPFDDYRKIMLTKPAVTLVMDVTVAERDRGCTDVAERHKLIYKHACQSNKEGRPCRVVGAFSARILDTEAAQTFRTYFILKDFDDPIFPSIWAAFENNPSCNDYLNVYMDFFIGTHHSGNGHAVRFDVAPDISGETIIVPPSTYIYDSRNERR